MQLQWMELRNFQIWVITLFPKVAGQLSAPWTSLFFEVGDLTKLLPQLERLLGEKPRLFWSVEYKVIYSSWVLEDRGCTGSSWIDFYLVSLLGSAQVGIHQFQHVHTYYPSRSKQKEIEFTSVAGNKLLWSGHEEEEWLQCCQSNQGPLEPHRALHQTSEALAIRDDNSIRHDQAKERYDPTADKMGA